MSACAEDKVARKVLQFIAAELVTETESCSKKRQRELRLPFGREKDLGVLGGFANAGEHGQLRFCRARLGGLRCWLRRRAGQVRSARGTNLFEQEIHQP